MPIFGLLLFTFVCILIALAALGVGIVIAALVSVAIIALLSAGVISSSVLVGLTSRSPFTGVRLAALQLFALLGCAAGVGVMLFLRLFLHQQVNIRFNGWSRPASSPAF